MEFRHRFPIFILVAVVFLAPVAGTAQTANCTGQIDNCFLLRAAAGDIATVIAAHALSDARDIRPGDPVIKMVGGPSAVPPEATLEALAADPLVIGVELVKRTAVTEGVAGAGVDTADPALSTSLYSTGTYSGPEATFFETDLWNGFVSQPAADLMNISRAHADPRAEAMGVGVVAVIDTGVDPGHPLLQGALVPGYDFILDQAGDASEWVGLDPLTQGATRQALELVADQSYTTIVDGGGQAFVEQSYTTIVDQSYTTIVDQSYTTIVDSLDLPPGFGHGTMVAGLVRLAAPGAVIMPLRVFDAYGKGDLGQIIRAIYYAVDNGADVINMSFSTSGFSAELLQAINHAELAGVLCVTSTGNGGNAGITYPAAFSNVLGVASSDYQDGKSAFTSFGSNKTFMAATGEALITAFPGGLYAAAWGTSFSSALVAGAATLLSQVHGDGSYSPVGLNAAKEAFSASSAPTQHPAHLLGKGRLDVERALHCGPTGGSCG